MPEEYKKTWTEWEQTDMEAKKDTSTMDYGEIFKGNTRAFEQLFKNYYAPLRGYCQGIVIDKQISEDIVQDAFVVLICIV